MTSYSLLLVALSFAALCTDLRSGRIPNFLTMPIFVAAAPLRYHVQGPEGIFDWFFCIAVPLLLLWPAFRFRMLGAGDIKLITALCALLPRSDVLPFLVLVFLAGGIFSLWVLSRKGLFRARLNYARNYVKTLLRTGRITPYRRPGPAPENVSFAPAVFAGTLLYLFVLPQIAAHLPR